MSTKYRRIFPALFAIPATSKTASHAPTSADRAVINDIVQAAALIARTAAALTANIGRRTGLKIT